jgi:hypothetical protein
MIQSGQEALMSGSQAADELITDVRGFPGCLRLDSQVLTDSVLPVIKLDLECAVPKLSRAGEILYLISTVDVKDGEALRLACSGFQAR